MIEQSSVREIMNQFGDIEPAPLPGWGEIIQQTTDGFLSLPPDADKRRYRISCWTNF